jgi:hypothetical protein
VEVSRLAAISQPCKGQPKDCACPWDRIATCPGGVCVADGVELVVERAHAATQLCAPGPDAGVLALSPPPGALPTAPCDEGELYKCAGGTVIACTANAVVAQCLRGCDAEGAGIDEEAVDRVAAVAILCSR